MSLIQFTTKQSEAFELIKSEKYNFILYGGAIRGGKTIWGLASLLVLCQIFPKSRWAVVRESNERIRKTTIPSFNNNFTKRGTLRQSPYEYTHHNGSVILFIGENYKNDKELDAFKGLEVNGFLFEEINECQEVTLYKAFERAGSWIIPNAKRQPKPIVLATCNPSNNWVKELVYKPYKENKLPNKWAYIPAKITDNPHLPQDYIESLKNLPRYQYMVYVEGDWDVQLKVGGEFYKCFELDKHVKPCTYNSELPLLVSFDENVNPYLPCGIFQLEGKELRMIDEIAMKSPNNKVSDICREIKRKYPAHRNGMYIYGDATSQKEDTKIEKGYDFFKLIKDQLKEYNPQLKVAKSNPSVVMRGNFINTVFETNFGGIDVIISEKCFLTINDLILVKENADFTKFKEMETDSTTKVRYQKVGHFSDCFIGSTLISTSEGHKPIKDIKIGDMVLTRHGYKKVLKTWDKGLKKVSTYNIGQHAITCTKDHKIFTDEYGFKEIGHLTLWNTFCILDENLNICKKKLLITKGLTLLDTRIQKTEAKDAKIELMQENYEKEQRVYDIMVEDKHEFFANGVLVHNCFDYIFCEVFKNDFHNYQRGGVESNPILGKRREVIERHQY